LVKTCGQRPFFRDVRVASSNRAYHFTRKFGAAIAECSMTFPTVIEMRRQEAVEIVGQTLLEFVALHRRVGHCLLQNTSFKLSRRLWYRSHPARLNCATHRRESFVTHGALHRVLGHESISFRTNYTLNVVGQKIFEIHTKHRYFSLPAAFILA